MIKIKLHKILPVRKNNYDEINIEEKGRLKHFNTRLRLFYVDSF